MTKKDIIKMSEIEYPVPKRELYPTYKDWLQEKYRVIDMRSGFVKGFVRGMEVFKERL